MKTIFKCRRTVTALFTITAIGALGAYLKVDTSGAMSVVAIALASSNAAQAVFATKYGNPKGAADVNSGSPKDTK